MRKEIILMLHISYAVGHVTVEPRNEAVVAGEMMSMECRTDEESRVRKWDLLRANGEIFTVYSHGKPSPYHEEFIHFGVHVNANGWGILYTNSTRLSDAGLYTCLVREGPDGKAVKVSAQLTVLESQPICETNLIADGNKSLAVGDSIWFRCNVTFRGFWTPTMEWRQHSGNRNVGRTVTDGVEIVRLPNESVISTLTIVVDSSMNGVVFSCKTYFTKYDGKTFVDTVNNIPNFNYTWSSETVELPNYPVSGTVTGAIEPAISSSVWTLLVAGLSVFLILLAIFAVVLGIHYKEKIFDRRRIIPDVVQHEDLSIQPISYATYEEITFDQPAQRRPNADPRQLPEARKVRHGKIPIYAEVNKPRASVGNCQTDKEMPAEIRQPSKTYTGDDGTQYMDVNKFRESTSVVPVKHPPMISLVETYASIDHTLGVPPPPLPSRSQRPI